MKDAGATASAARRKACAYVRVSTDEQAKHQTSIDSQIAAIERWCAAENVDLVDTYVEPGLSGTDDGRPQFVAMLDRATGTDHPYELVVVYSLSRFARDLTLQLVSYQRLPRTLLERVRGQPDESRRRRVQSTLQ